MHQNTVMDRIAENLQVLARASIPSLTTKKGGLGGVAALCRLKGKHLKLEPN